MESLANTEFFVNTGGETPVYAKQYGRYVPFSDIPDNLINILFVRFLDYPEILRSCKLPTDSNRDVVEKIIVKVWGKLDNTLDIDADGNFHFDPIDIETAVADCRVNLDKRICENKDMIASFNKAVVSMENSIVNLMNLIR